MSDLWALGLQKDDGDPESIGNTKYVEWHLGLSENGPVLCGDTAPIECAEKVEGDPDLCDLWQCPECMVALANENARLRAALKLLRDKAGAHVCEAAKSGYLESLSSVWVLGVARDALKEVSPCADSPQSQPSE